MTILLIVRKTTKDYGCIRNLTGKQALPVAQWKLVEAYI